MPDQKKDSREEMQKDVRDIKKIVKKNREAIEEMHAMTKKIKNYIIFQKIITVLKIVIIAIPYLYTSSGIISTDRASRSRLHHRS